MTADFEIETSLDVIYRTLQTYPGLPDAILCGFIRLELLKHNERKVRRAVAGATSAVNSLATEEHFPSS